MKKALLQKVKETTLGRADLKFEMSRIQQKSRNLNLGFVQIVCSFNFYVKWNTWSFLETFWVYSNGRFWTNSKATPRSTPGKWNPLSLAGTRPGSSCNACICAQIYNRSSRELLHGTFLSTPPCYGAANLLTFDAAVRVHYALKITTIN